MRSLSENMSRNDSIWERGLRILYFTMPMNEREAIATLRRYLEISEEEAKEIYREWLEEP